MKDEEGFFAFFWRGLGETKILRRARYARLDRGGSHRHTDGRFDLGGLGLHRHLPVGLPFTIQTSELGTNY